MKSQNEKIKCLDPEFFSYPIRFAIFWRREFKRYDGTNRYSKLHAALNAFQAMYTPFIKSSEILCQRDVLKKDVESCLKTLKEFMAITQDYFLCIPENGKPLNTLEMSMIEHLLDANTRFSVVLGSLLKKL